MTNSKSQAARLIDWLLGPHSGRLIALLLVLCSQLAHAGSASACGSAAQCKPESQHPLSQLVLSDGMGGTSTAVNVDLPGVYSAAQTACDNYAKAHSNATYTYSFNGSCRPDLPLASTNAGGSASSISVTGTLTQVSNSNGAVVSVTTSSWGMLTAGCSDSVNPNLPALGLNGQCFCNYAYTWSNSKQSCVAAMDKWMDPGPCPVCTAASTPRFGHPIDPLSGAKVITEPLGIRIGHEDLTLAYDSRTKLPYAGSTSILNGAPGPALAPATSFGSGLWTTNAHKSLYLQRLYAYSLTGFVVHAFRGDGRFVSFDHPNNTTYTPINATTREQLVPVLDASGNQTNQVRLIDAAGNIELYDTYGLSTNWYGDLLSVTYANGGSVSYSYTTGFTPVPGLLNKMVDDQGRTVTFNYEATNLAVSARLTQITGPDGGAYQFGYDAAGNLSHITWPDGKVRKFVYERSDLPWAVTGVIDENNSRLRTYGYDSAGLPISTELAGGADRYAVTYDTPPSLSVVEIPNGSVLTRIHSMSPPQVRVTLPSGAQQDLSAVSVNNAPALSQAVQPAGSGSGEASSGRTYDASGNVVSLDDAQGSRSCYSYDSSNRQTVRVEGLSTTSACSGVLPAGSTLPSGARKVTTSWHPDWRLPTAVTEPLRKTTTVYHGQPDPFNGNATANCTSAANLPNGKPLPVKCKVVIQGLLANGSVDSSVAARADNYTYDGAGRVLTHTDPNGKLASYSYYAAESFPGSAPGTYDPDYALVSVLLHGNGSNGSTTFVDNSISPLSATAMGNAQVSTAQSKFGGASMALNGNGDYVSIANSSALDLASDFTIELWVYPNATMNSSTGQKVFIGKWVSSGNASWMIDYYQGSVRGLLYTTSNTTLVTSGAATLTAGTWNHIAYTRSGSNFYLFVNGVLLGTSSSSALQRTTTTPALVGYMGGGSGTEYLSAYIDDLRVTKGKARYTASFSVPTAQFPDHDIVRTLADTGHAAGDLQSVTNAAGQVTQYTLYDPAGRVRQMVDPKGITTDIVYTPRGWVSTLTVTPPGGSGRTSTYSYDNAGQMTGVALPDGTSLAYSYDAAHRLTGVTDAQGNSITYTLDAAGNRTGEDVRDASGTLKRSIARSFDALSRVQQVTGAAQ